MENIDGLHKILESKILNIGDKREISAQTLHTVKCAIGIESELNRIEAASNSDCTDLINESISLTNQSIDLANRSLTNLQDALNTCGTCPPPCPCSGTVATSISSATAVFLDTELSGRAALLANICHDCNPSESSFIFSFLTDNAFPFVVVSTKIESVCCVPSPGYMITSGVANFQVDVTPLDNLVFSLGFGETAGQCSYVINVKEPNKPNPVFNSTGIITGCAEDIRITFCTGNG